MPTRKETILNDPQVIYCPPIFAKGVVIRIKVKCATCHQPIDICLTSYWKQRRKLTGPWSCFPCRKPLIAEKARKNPLYQSQEYKEQFRKLHQDPNYYAKVHNQETNKKISKALKRLWQDKVKRAKMLESRLTPEARAKIGEWAKKQWQDSSYRTHQHELRQSPEYKSKASERSKKLWANPAYRTIIIEALDKARPTSAPKTNVSSLQRILYSILSDLQLDFDVEGPSTIIGPIVTTNSRFEGYSFDCLLRHNGRKILIDCHLLYL